jgi:protein-disulfide isomerase
MAKQRANGGKKPSPVRAGKTSPGTRGFYILIGAIAVVGIASLSYLAAKPKGGGSQWDSTLPKLTAMGHVEGSDSAQLEVIEFADFECPICGQFATLTEPDIRTHLIDSGVVRLRYMDFPLSQHRNTWNAHRAAWCAGDQGKFWPMHDAIYRYQDSWNTEATDNPDKVLAGIAKGIGLNMDQYSACIAAKKYQAQLQANEMEAERRHVDATPTFVFGNTVIANYLTYDQFNAQVKQALAAKKAAEKK